MKSFVNSKSSGGFIHAVVLGTVMGYITVFVMLAVFALVLMLSDSGDGASGIFATVSLALSGLFCGLTAAKKLGSKALIVGLAAGTLFYISVAVISVAVTKSGFSSLFLVRFLLTAAMSGLGSFLSTVKKKRKNII